MSRVRYVVEGASGEAMAPAGYYLPKREEFLEHQGRRVLYTLGEVCIETSCCGTGSWNYIRVQGFLEGDTPKRDEEGRAYFDVETVVDPADRVAISRLLRERYPEARVEFR